MTKLLILHTGGTIASKVDYETGGVTNLTTPEELLDQYPQLQDIAEVKAEFVANMSSDDMRFAHWNVLAKAVKKHAKNVDGIIITHGTDTMHYTAAALHYALLGVPIPVVLTGSQRSSDRGSSDAATNLLSAARFAATKTPGVFVAMHENMSDETIAIHHAVNSRKMHSSRRDAFRSVNHSLAGRVSGDDVQVDVKTSDKDFSPTTYNEDLKIGMAYAHPNMHPDELSRFTDFDALILLGTGLGHFPINDEDDATAIHKDIREALEKLAKNMHVIMGTQTIYGRVNMQVYSAGRRHMDLGVLGHDLAYTPETLFVKTAWLLSQGKNVEKELGADYDDVIARTTEDGYE